MVSDYSQLLTAQALNIQARNVAELEVEQKQKEQALASSQSSSKDNYIQDRIAEGYKLNSDGTLTKTDGDVIKTIKIDETNGTASITTTNIPQAQQQIPTSQLQQLESQIRTLNKQYKTAPDAQTKQYIANRIDQLEEAKSNLIHSGTAYYSQPAETSTTTTPVVENIFTNTPAVTPEYRSTFQNALFYEIPLTPTETQPVYTFENQKLTPTTQTINPVTFEQINTPQASTHTSEQQIPAVLEQAKVNFEPSQQTVQRQTNIQESMTPTQQQQFFLGEALKTSNEMQTYNATQSLVQGYIKEAKDIQEQTLKGETYFKEENGGFKKPSIIETGIVLGGYGAYSLIKGATLNSFNILSPITTEGNLQIPIVTPSYQFGKYLVTGEYIPDVITNPIGTVGEFVGMTKALQSTPLKQVGEAEFKYGVTEPAKFLGEASRQATRNVGERGGFSVPTMKDFFNTIYDVNERKGLEYEGKTVSNAKIIDITPIGTERSVVVSGQVFDRFFNDFVKNNENVVIVQRSRPSDFSREKGIPYPPKTAIESTRVEPLQLTKDTNFIDLTSLSENGKNIPSTTEIGLTPQQARTERQIAKIEYVTVPKFDNLGNELNYGSKNVLSSGNENTILVPREDYNRYLRQTKGNVQLIAQNELEQQKAAQTAKGIFNERQTLREQQLQEKLNTITVPRYDSIGNEIPYNTRFKFNPTEKTIDIPQKDYTKYLRRTANPLTFEQEMRRLANEEKTKRYIQQKQLDIERQTLREQQKIEQKGGLVPVPKYDNLGNELNYGTRQVKELNSQTILITRQDYNKYLRRTIERTKPVEELKTNLISGLIEVKVENNKPSQLFKKFETKEVKPQQQPQKEIETGKGGQVQILKPPEQKIKKPILKKKVIASSVPEEPNLQHASASTVQETSLTLYSNEPISEASQSFNQEFRQKIYGQSTPAFKQNFAPVLEQIKLNIQFIQPSQQQSTSTEMKQLSNTKIDLGTTQTQFQQLEQQQQPIQQNKVSQTQEQIFKVDQAFLPAIKIAQLTQQSQIQFQEQVQRQETKQKQELFTEQIQEIENNIVPKTGNIFAERENKKFKGKFKAVTKVRGKVVSIAGSESESPFESLSTGAGFVKQKLARSLGVINTETGSFEAIGILPSGFRTSKVSGNPFAIQTNALSSQSEISEIQSARKKGIKIFG